MEEKLYLMILKVSQAFASQKVVIKKEAPCFPTLCPIGKPCIRESYILGEEGVSP